MLIQCLIQKQTVLSLQKRKRDALPTGKYNIVLQIDTIRTIEHLLQTKKALDECFLWSRRDLN